MPAQTAFQLSLPIDSSRVGRPRLNRYFRLLSRFYEPYLLLFCLGQTQEGHTPYPASVSEHQEQRRQFMRNLAVICDYKKGGKSFTAFAISRDGQHNVYWLGSPQAQKCARMLRDSLKALLEYATAPSKLKDNLHSDFLRMPLCFVYKTYPNARPRTMTQWCSGDPAKVYRRKNVAASPALGTPSDAWRLVVKIVKKLFTPKRPDADSQTTVNGILRRMLPVDKQAELDELKLKLEAMQQDSRLLNNYMDNYRSCKPAIVHTSRLASAASFYLNWGPPQIENFDPKDASSIRQRDLMNKIIQAVRGAALDQLWGRRHPRDGHPDSTAGVPSVAPSQVTLRGWYNASNVGALPHESARLSDFDSGYSSSAIQGLLETDLSFTGDVVTSSGMTGPEKQIPESSDDDDSDDEEGGALV
ncbi:hypothetical protein LMH87_009428 [Akanthomyces muscarius]|uniref:Uncharacterized protein n=1 Tax=Akanthomyces muscarius TaxID=2231603 RepID=A0A9W8QC31_AKAMU|nr:hypothetical protein LMH87_009428 [Akanthomyces muscarius]KAJ4152910.1 hypothetical protein LMH87_009428 [Akanthomyces muscarius]